MGNWIYTHSPDDSSRYVLGLEGERMAVCIGVNPSTARPGDLDPTLRTVSNALGRVGYDGFLMLNLYPLRSTDPNGLPASCDPALHKANLDACHAAIECYQPTLVWAAWGTLIEKRTYLQSCAYDLFQTCSKPQQEWVTRGAISKMGHPHHPLYVRNDAPFDAWDAEMYFHQKTFRKT